MTDATKTIKGPATQEFIDIDKIRDGIVIMKNGGLRMVLLCGSRNLELESIDSQSAIIGAYADFINSFEWPLQILIHSRKMDIKPYLASLEERLKVQENELLKIQTAEYIDFMKSFVTLSEIMVKRFYVVVPFDLIESSKEGPLDKIGSLFRPMSKKPEEMDDEKFRGYQTQLLQRTEHTILTLAHVGIRSAALQTEELIELFYNLYNPEEHESNISK
ncbi:MAG: hypothetical protein UV53_C0011G0007 [Candidatus Azambacteria bacterium GW2011_GWE1_42_9]|nr:MAG: hypothetical protein UU33_C0001G0369 [Candidatus Azambacteria bacterium GW2011_GWF1_41_10]KKS49403.1 MAG: hypothetical protein UV14_C0001G0149 [Candidatus Azambacteria bacterium GW2011_GWF2_42_22]KKS69464.1 MAG: hypothetical protein UV39_C0010G0004 [Candidatus Azambacteria bacterium GW2011_GWA2_42_62]KKS74325.1 MAG: hypothetical protein UV45_C0007G0019 [Candidatus Azambacteria bacterium GW2011_GWB1_42_72]KKS79234.1 MAG: hypothetical protein UV53_C0011G0007 [Candidatus Azambacteria bacte